MKELLIAALLLFSTFNPQFCLAQKKEKCTMCKADVQDHQSPYSTSFKSEWPYLLAGTSLAVGGYLLVNFDNVTPFSQAQLDGLNRNDINAFDRGATYNYNESAATASDFLILGTAVLPAVFLANHPTKKDFVTLLFISYEVATINYGITNTVKSLVNRSRPYVYNPELTYEERTDADSRYSFFSGHTSTTASFSFMAAKIITDYHPGMKTGLKVGIWSFAALLPATTGYLRVEAGKHYPTDVITGYVMGALTGWLVPHLHKKGHENISIYSTRLFNQPALGLTLRF